MAGWVAHRRICVDRWLGLSVDSGITGLLGLSPGLGYQVPSMGLN